MQAERILFITGSFEPGKDGVGDYAFILASGCREKGVACAILAYHDVYTDTPVKEYFLEGIEILKLNAALTVREKRAACLPFIAKFNPSWVSIQLVCYAFQKRGWIFRLGRELKSLVAASVRMQVMVHEIWLGFASNHSWQEKARGTIQKAAIKTFFRDLKPDLVHAGNNVYFSILSSFIPNLKYLPLLSNIPLNANPETEWLAKKLGISASERKEYRVGLFFGSIQGQWDLAKVLNKLISLADGKKLLLVSAGKQGFGTLIWDVMTREWSHRIRFEKIGFASDKQVSDLLSFSDFGICTTPLSLLGKSGSTMAMIEHGLPVIVTRDELKYPFKLINKEEKHPQIYRWDKAEEADIHPYPVLADRTWSVVKSFLKSMDLNVD